MANVETVEAPIRKILRAARVEPRNFLRPMLIGSRVAREATFQLRDVAKFLRYEVCAGLDPRRIARPWVSLLVAS
jgi:hypothetical protein